jgi:hypothetical protein
MVDWYARIVLTVIAVSLVVLTGQQVMVMRAISSIDISVPSRQAVVVCEDFANNSCGGGVLVHGKVEVENETSAFPGGGTLPLDVRVR